MASDKELLKEAQALIQEQTDVLERIGSSALKTGVVIGRMQDKMFLVVGGETFAVPDTLQNVGTQVLVHAQSMQVVSEIVSPNVGPIHTVSRVTEDGLEIAIHDSASLVSPGLFSGLKKGDRVRLDPSNSVVIGIVEKAPRPANVAKTIKVHWDDIGGNEQAKMLLREAIELPYQHPQIYKHYGKKPMAGILMCGPPGCGKTMLAQAAATACGADGGFLSIKGPEILDPYVGVAEAAVRNIFRQAKEYKASTGRSAVIFIDEAEAILSHRGGRHSMMEKTIVPAFLAEMNGLEESNALVILATNREDQLDPAVIRDGRIDFKLKVDRPNKTTAHDILNIHLKPKPIAKGITHKELAEKASEILYGADASWLPHSGALLAGVVEKAVTSAIRRDLETKKTSGLCHSDIDWAVNQTINQEKFQLQAA